MSLPVNVTARVPPNPSAAAMAREWCERMLHAATATVADEAAVRLVDDATLIVSELVTNSVRAGGLSIEVRLSLTRERLRLGVFDDAPGTPRLLSARPQDDHGRGLALVDALSAGWGVEPAPTGKEVWVDLELPG